MISFGWTTPALLAGVKTVTRRHWVPTHARYFTEGKLVDAWNTSPRNKNGDPHKIATIRLTQDAQLELTNLAPAEDWYREGLDYLQHEGYSVDGQRPRALWSQWINPYSTLALYVVRFEVVEVLP